MCKLVIEKESEEKIIGRFEYEPEEYACARSAVKSTLDKFELILAVNRAGKWVDDSNDEKGCSLCSYSESAGFRAGCGSCPAYKAIGKWCMRYDPFSKFLKSGTAEEQIKHTVNIIAMLRELLSDVEEGKYV